MILLVTRPVVEAPSGGDLYNRFFVNALLDMGLPARLCAVDALAEETVADARDVCVIADGLVAAWPMRVYLPWLEHRSVVHRILLNHVPAAALGSEGAGRRKAEADLTAQCDAVVFSSAHARSVAPPEAQQKPWWVMHPGRSPDGIGPSRTRWRDASGVLSLLCLGAISEHKQSLALLEAFAACRQASRCRLRFAGPLTEAAYGARFLEAIAAAAARGCNVEYLGALRRADVWISIEQSDAMIVASRYESFGMSALEAVQLGLPVIFAAAGGPAEWLTSGRDSLQLLALTPEHLDEAITTLTTRGASLREGARRLGEAWPSWQTQATRFMAWLRRDARMEACSWA
jgi:glycosyltransferase involved in cell wall biosynthesis